jgi:AraC-like DNA-binding protein
MAGLSYDMTVTKEPTVGLASARAIIDYFQHLNMSPAQLADELNVDEALLTEEDQRLPLSIYQKIWELAVTKSQKPELGLCIAQQESYEDLGLVAHVVLNSKTIGEGMKQYIRLFSVVNEAIELEFEESPKQAQLKFIYKNSDYYNVSDMERTLAIAVNRTAKATGIDTMVYAVHFQHSKPAYAEKYKELFNCKVLFDQPYCEVVFDLKLLHLKPKRRNPHMRMAMLNYANQTMSRLFKRSISHKVKRLIEKNICDGSFDAEMVSNQLNMSRQTMYRKLKNDGASYSELVDQVRQDKAFFLLKQSQLPLTVIAYDLGFSELSAFTRAFKRWTGKNPAEYRKQLLAKQNSH